ncbi:S-layer homology domain-containing protein [Sporosarcina trichiuri]|uniref:S-layer homology domain-containing protein n=1 Tax=Sporosarcina trichiuri TaxID=3056445 RepID=UPI0025B45F66|nr:S-layer homology domain-containing protein [Sporosarcina sp. 0.2-SM1T-5]WJY26692.1 S-layer homology domain-containing protein [Sporosarcina sp. 0.2-SM1T-5]
MKKLWTLVTVIGLSFILAAQPAVAAGFPDVPKTNRFHDEINFLVGKNIISGYTTGKFQPKKDVTRGEAAIMVGRMLDLNGTKRATKFKDVGKNYGASGYIASAADRKIINGYPDGTFRPNEKISRGDMAMILERSFGIMAGSYGRFSDVGHHMNASTAIFEMAGAHIVTGYPDGTFRPTANVTREQFSAFLARGLSTEFKQRTLNKDGYAYDLTKTYTYAQPKGELQVAYKKVTIKPAEVTFHGYLWEFKDTGDGSVYHLDQRETKDGLYMVHPLSEAEKELIYPVKLNTKWQPGMDFHERVTITGINKTVKTPYKTFTKAVEATNTNGNKSYFVKGIGRVKTVDKSGKMISELKSIQ